MNKVTSKVINRLAHLEANKAITIYMPTVDVASPAGIQENQTRLKNAIRQGIEQLEVEQDSGMIKALESTIEIANDPAFWQENMRSLALFAAGQEVEMYQLPHEVSQQVYVGTTFDTLALYELQNMYQPFYVFALAQHDPKLFYGDIYGIEPIEIDLPRSMEDALNIDEMFAGSNTIRAGGGSLQGSPHGQGDSQQAGQEERLMYFRMLDERIQHSKQIDNDLPIIIAATESEAADFKAVSKLTNIIDAHIPGNRTKEETAEIHQLALEIIQKEMAEQKHASFRELYEEKRGADKATNNFGEICQAAEMGRVDTLLLGVFESTRDSVKGGDEHATATRPIPSQSEKSSLLELVRMVLRNGGTVKAINRMFIPGRAMAAAVLRY